MALDLPNDVRRSVSFREWENCILLKDWLNSKKRQRKDIVALKIVDD
jgi:hypothetical protein